VIRELWAAAQRKWGKAVALGRVALATHTSTAAALARTACYFPPSLPLSLSPSRVQSYVAFALVGTVVLYTILVIVVVSIACCCSSKFKPAGAGAKVWDGTLNFFGLRELMPVAPAAAKGKGGDEDDVEAGAGGADKDDAKAQKQPLLGGDDKKEKKDKKKKEKEVAVASGTPAAYAEGKPGSA